MKRTLLLSLFALLWSHTSAQRFEVHIAPYRDDKSCAISYTFDDGLRDQYTLAAPQLERLGWRGTFTINGRKIDVAMAKGDTTRFSWSEAADLHRRGHEISNHGWEHKKMTRLTPERIRQEIERNDSAILRHVGIHPLSFCYPYNSKDTLIRRMAEEGRVTSRMYQVAVGRASSAQKLTRWVDRTIAQKGWGIGMTHGILSGYDAFQAYADFENHLLYTKSKEAQIWVAPLAEVAAYIAEREALQLEQRRQKGRLILTPRLDLDPKLYFVPLTLVIEGCSKPPKVRQGKRRLSVTACEKGYLVDIDPHGGSVRIDQ